MLAVFKSQMLKEPWLVQKLCEASGVHWINADSDLMPEPGATLQKAQRTPRPATACLGPEDL